MSTSCSRCHTSVPRCPFLLRPLPALLVNPQDRPCKTPRRQTPPWRLRPAPRNHRSATSSAWLFSSLVTSPENGATKFSRFGGSRTPRRRAQFCPHRSPTHRQRLGLSSTPEWQLLTP